MNNIFDLYIILAIVLLYIYISQNSENYPLESSVEKFELENTNRFFNSGIDLKSIVDLDDVSAPIQSNIIGTDGGDPIPKLKLAVSGQGKSCKEWKDTNNPAYENIEGNYCTTNWNENGNNNGVYKCLVDKYVISNIPPKGNSRKGGFRGMGRSIRSRGSRVSPRRMINEPVMERCNPLLRDVRKAETQDFTNIRNQLIETNKEKIANVDIRRDEENKYLDEVIQKYKNRKDKISFLSYFIDRNKQIISTNNNRITKYKNKHTKMDKDYNIDISEYNKANRQTREKQKQITYLTKYFKIASGIFIIAIILNIWISMKKK